MRVFLCLPASVPPWYFFSTLPWMRVISSFDASETLYLLKMEFYFLLLILLLNFSFSFLVFASFDQGCPCISSSKMCSPSLFLPDIGFYDRMIVYAVGIAHILEFKGCVLYR